MYRYEPSGTLHGLLRVRGFTQDDAHLFLRPDQLDEEIFTLLDFTLFVLRSFGFERYDVYLSTRPEKYAGTLEHWDLAEIALRNALERKGLPFEVDPGEGVFYGPKIDIKIKDMLGRSWQCSTIQVDFNNPERFDATYVADDGTPRRAMTTAPVGATLAQNGPPGSRAGCPRRSFTIRTARRAVRYEKAI